MLMRDIDICYFQNQQKQTIVTDNYVPYLVKNFYNS